MHETLTEERARTLGTFETAQRRTRKGRSTFVVTERRQRRMAGQHAMLPDSGDVDWVAPGTDLVALADMWMRTQHPSEVSVRNGGTRPCTCDDLTAPSLVVDRETGRPIWVSARKGRDDAETIGHYVTRDLVVRRCHCGYPSLLGTDLGLSWSQLGPSPYRCAYRSARKSQGNAARTRKRQVERKARTCEYDTELTILAQRLAETEAPVVEVLDFPDVTISIRRGSSPAMSVTMTRGLEVIKFRARTAAAIARRVIA